MLDTTELNPRWAPVGSEAQRRCEAFVEERNDVSGNAGLESPDGKRLDAYRARLKPWGGGIGETQMEWLRATLASAAENGERVVVASHVRVSRTAARPR